MSFVVVFSAIAFAADPPPLDRQITGLFPRAWNGKFGARLLGQSLPIRVEGPN